MNGRIPPHNIQAEKNALGIFLLNQKAVYNELHSLQPSDFYLLAHQKIFEAMQQLESSNKPIDIITVTDWLDSELENVGDYKYFTLLTDSIATTSNIGEYIKIIKESSKLRRLIEIAGDISERALNNEPVTAITEQAEQSIYDMADTDTRQIQTFKEVAERTIKRLERKYAGEEVLLRTFFPVLDNIIGGIGKTDFTILAARPAMGKTALALNLAKNFAKFANKKVMIFSREMNDEDMMERVLSFTTGTSYGHIRTGKLSENEWDKICDYEILDILIDDNPSKSLMDMKSVIRKNKPDVVIIDYLQLMETSSKSENRTQEVSKLTRRLKLMCMELKIPFIVLSQLSRNCEQRTNKRPKLSDLRESGSIEQDADNVLALYRADEYEANPDLHDNSAEIIILKFRGSRTGTAVLKWNGDKMIFYDEDFR